MDRPYIICHMETALDGKITGPYMDTPEAESASEEYERVNRFYHPQAWVNGRVTIDENFTFYKKPELSDCTEDIPKKDFVAEKAESYIVAIDPSGRLGWERNYVEYAGRPKAYVIEVLTEQAGTAYLAFLRKLHISYIFAGETELNCTLAVQKLKALFGIERLKLSGGGVINWSFAKEGLIDELSVIVAPVADGAPDTPTLFERRPGDDFSGSVSFTLKSAEAAKDGCVWLRYLAKR